MTDLEIYQPPGDSPTAQALALVGPASQLIEQIVKTNFVPQAYRGKPAEALACVLTGEMLGLHPLVALREIDMIQGTPAYSAKMQRALVQKAGHKIWVEDSTPTKCVMAGHRAGEPEHVQRVTWTIDRAKTAGLTSKDNWRKQPQAMLIARATGELCRLIAADELLGLAYNADEVRDGTTSDEEVVEQVPADLATEAPEGVAPPQPARTRRALPAKKAAAKKAAARPVPARAETPADPVEDFDDIDQGPVTPPEKSPEQKRTEMVNIRIGEVLGKLERDEKLAFLSASVGHPVGSSKDLTSADVDAVLVDLTAIAAGDRAWVDGQLVDEAVLEDDDPPAAEQSPAAPAADDGWAALTDDDWKDLVTQKGLRVAAVMRQAAELGQELDVEAPTSVAGIAEADVGLRARLGEWIEAQG